MDDSATGAQDDLHFSIDVVVQKLAAGLAESNLKLAVAESFTGGLASKALLGVDGSNGWLRGSILTHDPDVIEGLFGAAGSTRTGADTAQAMAIAVGRLFGADTMLAVTKARTPGSGSDVVETGAWVAVSVGGDLTLHLVDATDEEALAPQALQHLASRLDGRRPDTGPEARIAVSEGPELPHRMAAPTGDPSFPGPEPGSQSAG